ncbi:MAG: sulfotransferase domain-containing protein, partial [Gammaproteobacteria bacterium]
MLLICNGAIKSGSTWLYNILINLVDCQAPPARYLTGRSAKSPCIKPEMLELFLATEDIRNNHYISKNHYADPKLKDLLSRYEDAYVFDIERDVKDVIVSNYYHDRFRNGYQGTFEQYYWEQGRGTAVKIARYHALWRDGGPHVY